MVTTFYGNPNATIISCYSLPNDSEQNDFIAFYNELSPLVSCISKHTVLVIGGDMNAQIGKNVNHNSNRNGEHPTDFTLEKWLTCLNTKFQKRKRKLWTNTNNTKAQIDFVFINKKRIAHWIVVHIPLSRGCPVITELSLQRYDWAYEGMQPK